MNERLNGFLCELRRSKVYRVAAGYAVVEWLVIQNCRDRLRLCNCRLGACA